MASTFVAAFQAALGEVGIKSAKLFFTSNDGTLLRADAAVKVHLLARQRCLALPSTALQPLQCSHILEINLISLDGGLHVQMPILLFQSGPVNSLRGAAFLSGVSDAIVLDIGGTTTDAGCLINGIARASPVTAKLAG